MTSDRTILITGVTVNQGGAVTQTLWHRRLVRNEGCHKVPQRSLGKRG